MMIILVLVVGRLDNEMENKFRSTRALHARN